MRDSLGLFRPMQCVSRTYECTRSPAIYRSTGRKSWRLHFGPFSPRSVSMAADACENNGASRRCARTLLRQVENSPPPLPPSPSPRRHHSSTRSASTQKLTRFRDSTETDLSVFAFALKNRTVGDALFSRAARFDRAWICREQPTERGCANVYGLRDCLRYN